MFSVCIILRFFSLLLLQNFIDTICHLAGYNESDIDHVYDVYDALYIEVGVTYHARYLM